MYWIRYNALLCAALLFANAGSAQKGSLQVVQSAAIKSLVERHIAYNKTRRISGYRIRIYSDNVVNSRQHAQEAKERFLQLYPNIRAYIWYDNPYFKVTAGDFRTRDEALVLLNQVRSHFPKAFVIADYIKLPLLHGESASDDNPAEE